MTGIYAGSGAYSHTWGNTIKSFQPHSLKTNRKSFNCCYGKDHSYIFHPNQPAQVYPATTAPCKPCKFSGKFFIGIFL